MHFLTTLFSRPPLHSLETALVPALNYTKAVESRLQKENGVLPGDLIERVLSYLPIEQKSTAGALASVSIRFYFHSRRLRENAHLYASSEFLRTEATHAVVSKRLERIIIELSDPSRNWYEQDKASTFANALRNSLAGTDGVVIGTHGPEMEAVYFLALKSLGCVPTHDVGPVLYELLRALPVVHADRKASTLNILRTATTALTGPKSPEWRLRCQVKLMDSEPDHAIVESDCKVIMESLVDLSSAARAQVFAELLRFASRRNDTLPNGDIDTINLLYAHTQQGMDQLDACDRAPVLISMTNLFKSLPTGMTPAILFVAISDGTQPITSHLARTQVLATLAKRIGMVPPGAQRCMALCALLEHASELPDLHKADVAQAFPLNLYISKYNHQFDRDAVERLNVFCDSLGQPYRSDARDGALGNILDRYKESPPQSGYVVGDLNY